MSKPAPKSRQIGRRQRQYFRRCRMLSNTVMPWESAVDRRGQIHVAQSPPYQVMADRNEFYLPTLKQQRAI